MTKRDLSALNPAIGAVVRELRQLRHMNQTEMCKLLGLDQSALSRVESGKQALTAAQWIALCECVGVENDQLTTLAALPKTQRPKYLERLLKT